jgi:hypothetical protein
MATDTSTQSFRFSEAWRYCSSSESTTNSFKKCPWWLGGARMLRWHQSTNLAYFSNTYNDLLQKCFMFLAACRAQLLSRAVAGVESLSRFVLGTLYAAAARKTGHVL